MSEQQNKEIDCCSKPHRVSGNFQLPTGGFFVDKCLNCGTFFNDSRTLITMNEGRHNAMEDIENYAEYKGLSIKGEEE